MPRRTRFTAALCSSHFCKPFPRRSLTLILLSLVMMFAAVVPAMAQMPPYRGLPVTVSTDKPVYAPGEPVKIGIAIANPTDTGQVLTFTSTLQADYVIDSSWRWSAGRAFPTVMTSISIPPGGRFAFPGFTHTPGDFYLTPGRHEITAEVGHYGVGTTTIAVGDSIPPQRPFLVSPSVSPDPAPFGTPITLGVTVTNVSSQTMSFGHDGCPVLFSIDQSWKPALNCPEYWTQVVLEPGQSISFTSEEYPYLVVQNTPALTLAPGWHSVQFEVPGVGATGARFEVTGESGAGSISGHVYRQDGAALEGAIVEAYPFDASDSTGVRMGGDGMPYPYPWRYYQAVTALDGSYTLEQIPPGAWAVRAFQFNSGEIWYNGAATRADADPVTVTENAATDSIDFVLPSSPPPPPSYDGIITGRVFDDPWPLKIASRPLPQAIVAAIALNSGGSDSGSVPPGDSTVVGYPGGGSSGPSDPVKPPYPPYPGGMPGPVFYGFPDSIGQYTIHLPLGTYKVIAIAPAFRYQWWQRTADYDSADDVRAHPIWFDSLPPMTDFALRPLPQDSLTADVTGVVRGWTGTPRMMCKTCDDGGFDPIAGARVAARPLVIDPRIMTLREEVYYAVTGADGAYRVTVPVTSPWIVEASADGYGTQYYNHATYPGAATPVDVTSGMTTPDINFDLFQYAPPPQEGSIAGIVYSWNPLSMSPGPGMPLAGAFVRLHPASPGHGFEMVTRTDLEGRFSFFGIPVPAGDSTAAGYYVSAEAPAHVPTYYRSATEWTAAEPVVPAGPYVRMMPLVISLPWQMAKGDFFAVGLVRSESWVGGPPPLPGGGGTGGGSGGTGGGGPDSTGSGIAGSGLADIVAPGDSTSTLWPLPGAFLYLVPADQPTDGPIVSVAGAAACQNGTLVINDVAPGRYKAYADRPGFVKAWFHGTNYLDAAAITIGPGIDPIVIDIVLTPLEGPPPPGGGGDGLTDLTPRIVTGIRNAPNPFKPQTTIIYRLMDDADVSLDIYDVSGRRVRRIFDRLHQPAGEQHVPWDGNSDDGTPSGAGIYFFRISTRSETSTGKMVMVR